MEYKVKKGKYSKHQPYMGSAVCFLHFRLSSTMPTSSYGQGKPEDQCQDTMQLMGWTVNKCSWPPSSLKDHPSLRWWDPHGHQPCWATICKEEVSSINLMRHPPSLLPHATSHFSTLQNAQVTMLGTNPPLLGHQAQHEHVNILFLPIPSIGLHLALLAASFPCGVLMLPKSVHTVGVAPSPSFIASASHCLLFFFRLSKNTHSLTFNTLNLSDTCPF